MKPTTDDIVEINQILSLWAHLVDNHAWDRFGEVFTEDAYFDSSVFGFTPVTGIAAICHMASRDGHAKAHHTTNVYVQEGAGDEITAVSKGLGLLSNGAVASVTYTDRLRRTPEGWRLASRTLALQAPR
ncbi:3-phenylpropionate/cinnamic acid dioxygenase small subunit [Rhizobium sp. BK226]|uniref:nuclear transport factor 2 family protein n=1 Tax=Rhizobium sp. BK226 TaxID=2587075 RepID=UPI0016123FAF|nr:nuclear transport factor 2 family protein [Rhizobium sp. BK226]MBB4115818.1 3-phenylpropionate/cinnamic acid dioxygenase small subunit [Rhizobium sp. BK226]